VATGPAQAPGPPAITAAATAPAAEAPTPPTIVAAAPLATLPLGPRVSADQTRSELAGLLGQIECGRVSGALDEDRALVLRGHVPSATDREALIGRLRSMSGIASVDATRLVELPKPHCGTVERLAGLGIPASSEQESDPSVLGPAAQSEILRFTNGQPVSFQLKSPDFPGYVYVDYYDAEGRVLHLMPNEFIPQRRLPPAQPFRIGDQRGLEMIVEPPFGLDLVVAIATSEPIFPRHRPTSEPADVYLRDLETALARARSGNRTFRSEYAYLFVLTSE
jgi:hypothetical protein